MSTTTTDHPSAVPTAASQETPDYLAPCASATFSPEIYDFYGDTATVLGKIDAQELPIAERRMYFLMVESSKGSEIRFFERVDEAHAAVFSWTGHAAADLRSQIDTAVLANRGVMCIGEQIKSLLGDQIALNLEGTVPAPATARAAFAHTVRTNGENGFLRATTAMLC